jgi:cyanophycinase-like exopeptidase
VVAFDDFWFMRIRLQARPLISLTLLAFMASGVFAQPIQTWRLGSDVDTPASPLGGIVLSGGAGEVDPAMQWFLQRANGGDVLVLRVSGSDGYQNYLYNELGVDVASVETIRFAAPSAANADYVVQRIAEAEAVWLAGGDQSDYVNFWQGTPVEDGLHALVARGGAIGGISAGMAVLGGGYFAAGNGTVYSSQALANPYDTDVDVRYGDFLNLPHLSGIITDTHFDDPDRRGRLLTFLARLVTDHGVSVPRAIACNEYAVVAIQPDGQAKVWGEWPDYEEYAYFVRPDCTSPSLGAGPAPEVCTDGEPLSWGISPDENGDADGHGGLLAAKVPAGYDGAISFDLNTWLPTENVEWERWTADGAGQFHSGPLPAQEAPEANPECGLDLTAIHPLAHRPSDGPQLELRLTPSNHWVVHSYHPTPILGRLYSAQGQVFGNLTLSPGSQPLELPAHARGPLLLWTEADILRIPTSR